MTEDTRKFYWIGTVLRRAAEPPPNAQVGDSYLVGRGRNAWKGQGNSIASLTRGPHGGLEWLFRPPKENNVVLVRSTHKQYLYQSGSWWEHVIHPRALVYRAGQWWKQVV
ncbi:MAG: hypothetical protein A2Y38_00385 [Spirochaetes bacterium GWB1_59_5]|nr:MAG: hypothetical protein A2Y38_00385 [Spirochaetes bacterium GWB1_59_5]